MPLRVRSGQRRLFACDALCHYRTYGTVTDCVNSRRRNAASSHICTIGTCLSWTSRATRQSFRFYRVQTFRYLNPLHPTEQRCRHPAGPRHDRVEHREPNICRSLYSEISPRGLKVLFVFVKFSRFLDGCRPCLLVRCSAVLSL
jgi:hypothetical protein